MSQAPPPSVILYMTLLAPLVVTSEQTSIGSPFFVIISVICNGPVVGVQATSSTVTRELVDELNSRRPSLFPDCFTIFIAR